MITKRRYIYTIHRIFTFLNTNVMYGCIKRRFIEILEINCYISVSFE